MICLTTVRVSLSHTTRNTEFFLVRIFPYLHWIRENMDQKKLRVWALFTHCQLILLVQVNVISCFLVYFWNLSNYIFSLFHQSGFVRISAVANEVSPCFIMFVVPKVIINHHYPIMRVRILLIKRFSGMNQCHWMNKCLWTAILRQQIPNSTKPSHSTAANKYLGDDLATSLPPVLLWRKFAPEEEQHLVVNFFSIIIKAHKT